MRVLRIGGNAHGSARQESKRGKDGSRGPERAVGIRIVHRRDTQVSGHRGESNEQPATDTTKDRKNRGKKKHAAEQIWREMRGICVEKERGQPPPHFAVFEY